MKTQFTMKSLSGVAALLLAVTLPLSGCSDDDDDDDSAATQTVGEQLAGQDADSEPGGLNDADSIRTGIEGLFGDPDSEPVDIEDGESVQDVFSKAGQ